MFTRVCLGLILIATIPVWSQVDMNAAGVGTETADQTQMQTPPPVSDEAYPTAIGSQARSNYLRTGWTTSIAYSDNVPVDVDAKPVSDISYSIWPTIAIDKTTSRLHLTSIYSPGFTVYQHTSALNQADQNMTFNLQYRLSPHLTASVRDTLLKSSNVFNQLDPLSRGSISGSAQSPTIGVYATAANQLNNAANAELTYQFSQNGMIGAAGVFTNLHYLDPAEAPGLYDSNSSGGSAFYNHRLSERHYIGATYQYSRILTYPVNAQAETQTHSILLFYTIYLNPKLSFSVSSGPQHFDVVQNSAPAYRSWSPAVTASMGWQGRHTNFAVSYGRTVTSGGGLAGAFLSNSASASGRWQLARTWNVGSVASYAINKNVTPASFSSNPGGHSVYGTIALQHSLNEHVTAQIGYTRLQQNYSGIQVISNAPDTNREFVSVTYQF